MLSTIIVAAVLAAAPAAPKQPASQETAAVQLAREVIPLQSYHRLIDGITVQVAQQLRAAAVQSGARIDAGFDDALRNLYVELLPYSDMVDLQARLLGKYFSDAEIVQIRDFYRTPVGAKMRDRMPDVMQDAMAFAIRRVQDKSQAIQERMKQYIHKDGGTAKPAKQR